MIRNLVILALFLMMSGCMAIPIATVVVTGGAGYLKYKGMSREAEALEGFREEIKPIVEEIKKEAKADD